MSKLKIVLMLLCMACVLNVQAKGKEKEKPVYAFGLSISFTDSVTYRTDIQQLEQVKLDESKMLPLRDQYAYQLKNYLEQDKGLTDRTCIIYFNQNLKKLNKELKKVVARVKKRNSILKVIEPAEFKFVKVTE